MQFCLFHSLKTTNKITNATFRICTNMFNKYTCVWIVSPVAAKNIDACFCPSFRQFLVKDSVQREITGVESGINR